MSHKKTADDVNDLKQSYGYLDERVTEVKSDIAEKASHMELAKLEKKKMTSKTVPKGIISSYGAHGKTQRKSTTV